MSFWDQTGNKFVWLSNYTNEQIEQKNGGPQEVGEPSESSSLRRAVIVVQ